MKRLILMVLAAGCIMWGAGEFCGYAAVPDCSFAVRKCNSDSNPLRYFAHQQLEFSGKGRTGVENAEYRLNLEYQRVESSNKYLRALVAALGNYCTTSEGGCELNSPQNKGDRCSCPDGSDGIVIKVKKRNVPQPVSDSSGGQNETDENKGKKEEKEGKTGKKVIPEDKDVKKSD